MDLITAIHERHSVRRYTDSEIPDDIICALQEEINACNSASGLHIQLVLNEPKAFDCFMAHYGKLTVVISLGYGKTQGVEHKRKSAEQVSNASPETPNCFKAGNGFYTKLDLGIVKYHFEIGAGNEDESKHS